MPSAATCSSDPTKRRGDYFLRRKVGSIRDNPKLLKIRQQFENACRDPALQSAVASAPSSVCLSSGGVLGDLLKINSRFADKTEAFLHSTSDPGRRNSEGDLSGRRCSYENAPPVQQPSPDHLRRKWSSGSIHLSLTPPAKYSLQTSSESGIHTGSSEEDRPLFAHEVDEGANKFFRDLAPPPIPRRGISRGVSATVQNGFPHLSPAPKSSTSVQKAIELYEGMSSSPKKAPRVKREDSRRGSFLLRRNSRRSSSLRSKSHKDEQPPPKKKEAPREGDDDRTEERCEQSIYQTLSQVVSVSRREEESDPYDRLSRVHDVLNRIHKGQPSSCAACKAAPPSLRHHYAADASFMQVQCNELSPHHHPPCICFSCQHSVFSCTVAPPGDAEDALYYNVCCLSAAPEGWRRSRRRPVCEQNGRLCVVNCDVEARALGAADCELRTSPPQLQQRDRSKLVSGDSCDSDEGWVDVTDSEDERSLTIGRREPSLRSENRSLPRPTDLNIHNSSYGLDHIVTKCSELDISRAVSSEHLYESILDIDTQAQDSTKDLSQSSQGSVPCSLKGDSTAENDLDSGEWSTESASPTFDESPTKETAEPKQSTLNQYRFTVNYEAQETAKKTFMKSVLGGKKVVNPKKKRMSNFFVPWFASSQDYGLSKSPKVSLKKHSMHSQPSSKGTPCKNKRSQSVPSVVPKVSIACTKSVVSATDLFAKKDGETDEMNTSLLNADNTLSICSRVSDASSAYIRSDQIQVSESTKPKSPAVSPSNVVECISERVHKRSPSGGSDRTYIMFQAIKEDDVPLYQFYERNIKERVSFCRSPKSLSPVMWSPTSSSCYQADITPKASQPSVVEQLSPDASQDMKMLWCELPEVKDSGILERISAQELKLQEAIFDLIQSEACYIRSLKVLHENFIRIPEFCEFESPTCVLSKHEHDVLFSDIVRVKEVSERLFGDLTARWSDGILIPDVCDIIHHNAALPSFAVYVRYCSNRVYQERTLRELKETRLCFLEVLRKLESNPVCQGLSLESFLFLPMQHISRLPLLLDNIFRWLVPESPSFETCKSALETVHKIFVQCNEGARKMERIEEMFVLHKLLEFKDCKVVPLISASRWLLKKGELMKLEFDKKTFGRSNRCVRVPIYLFLFNDLLIFTKRKSDDSYTVVDYCSRDKVQAKPINAQELQSPIVLPNTCRYLMYLTLSSNHQGASVDMIFNCSLLSERTRWLEAINGVEKIQSNEVWEYDYPQVQCIRSYVAQQPDELSLQDSDVVSITRKMNDGWYEGRRLRDGLEGWFPVSYTMDIPCSRVRASNIRQCYRLLMLSQTQK